VTNVVRVAPVGPEHAGELFTVQLAAYVGVAQRYSAPDVPPLRETPAQVLADIDAPDVLVFGAWLGHRLVGSVRGRPDGDRMEVARFAVAPDVQGRGVGRTLLAALEAAVPPGVRELWLCTGVASADSIRLYERAGYRPVGRSVDAAGIDLVVMAKPVGRHSTV
jgi:ribosomal protein S18 acetylase RimI-like enzyme